MIIDHLQINSLMRWAQLQAPLDRDSLRAAQPVPRRRVRIEIGAEVFFEQRKLHYFVVCRVYLAEPRTTVKTLGPYDYELDPIAETRIG